MEILNSIRNFLLVGLPESIDSVLGTFLNSVGNFIWVIFIFTTIVLGYLLLKATRKNIQLQNTDVRENEFLSELSSMNNAEEVENKIFDFALKIMKCRYSSLYELRGETYVLIGSNASLTGENQKIGISMRLSRNDLKNYTLSGNYNINKILSPDSEHLLVLYTNKDIDISRFRGSLMLALSFYKSLNNEVKVTSDKKLAQVSEETMQAIIKAQFGKEGYLKFLISVILKIFSAKGGEIVSHNNQEKYKVGNVDEKLQKEFFIRNTPYKFFYYDDKEITLDNIKDIGAFLDLSGSFLISLDHQSSIMQNYISFLKSANKIMENTMPYYDNHSEYVKIVSVEIAKSLFMDQQTIDNIELAAELHDIGMIGNMEMIMGDSELNSDEIDLMHYHPVIGSILLEPIAHLYPITTMVKQHHERYDGRGYPNALNSSEISLDSQALSLGEHFVGLVSDRSYKKGMEFELAVKEIEKVSGKMFDPVIVNAFIESKKTIEKKFVRLKNS